MRVRLIGLILPLLVLLASCATGGVGRQQRLAEGVAYVAFDFGAGRDFVELVDLDTRDVTVVRTRDRNQLEVESLPPGRYAITDIRRRDGNTEVAMELPYPLMTIIEVELDTITYLGRITVEEMSAGVPFLNWVPRRGTLSFGYDFDAFRSDLAELYQVPPTVRLKALSFLSIQ